MSDRLDLRRLRGRGWTVRVGRVILTVMGRRRMTTLRLVGNTDAQIARVIAAIEAEPQARWTVRGLARLAGLSRAAFARRFSRATGASPHRWLAGHRHRLAEDLLAGTDLALAAIAIRVGYRCEFAFAKAFKRQVGVAPGAFRRRTRELGFPATVMASAVLARAAA